MVTVVFSRIGKDMISYGITSCTSALSASRRRCPSCSSAAVICTLPEPPVVSRTPSTGSNWFTPWHLANSLHLNVYFDQSISLIEQCLLRLLSIWMSFLWMSLILPDTERSNFSQTAWTKWENIVQFDSSLSDKQHILQGLVNRTESLLSRFTRDRCLSGSQQSCFSWGVGVST